MKGSTARRGSTWTAYWDKTPDPETGMRRQGSKGGFRTRKDAQAHLSTVLVAVQNGTYVEPSKQLLGRFLIDEWLPAISGGTVRPLTLARYEKIVRTYIVKRDIGGVPLRSLSGGHMTALYGELHRAGLSVATRRLTHAVLRRALNDAVRWGKIARSPAHAADPPALPESKASSWSHRELRAFLAHVEGDRLYALWRLGATTGMRRGELLGLTWRHLDLDGGSLRVEQQLIPTTGGVTFGPPKSKRSKRRVALDAETVEALRQHRETQKLERAVAGPAYDDGDLVFADELGRPIHPQRLTQWFGQHRKAAGLPSGSLHILRHTHITHALTEGIPLHVVAARVGDKAETLLKTYAHLLQNSDEQAAEAVASLLVDKPLTNHEAPAVLAA
jgi:integrase